MRGRAETGIELAKCKDAAAQRGAVAAGTATSPSMLYVLLSRALCSFALPAQVARSSPCAQCDAAAVGRSNFRLVGGPPQAFMTLDLTKSLRETGAKASEGAGARVRPPRACKLVRPTTAACSPYTTHAAIRPDRRLQTSHPGGARYASDGRRRKTPLRTPDIAKRVEPSEVSTQNRAQALSRSVRPWRSQAGKLAFKVLSSPGAA